MTTRIINHYWQPAPPPPRGQWCCGGWGNNWCNNWSNNWMNKLFTYTFAYNCIDTLFGNLRYIIRGQDTTQQYYPYQYPVQPYQNYSIYPGLELSQNNMSYQDYLDAEQNKYEITQLKELYPEFNYKNFGGKYQAYLLNDRTVCLEGNSADELRTEIQNYVKAHPDVFKKKDDEEEA